MNPISTIELTYQSSLIQYVEKVADQPYTIWLDSSRPHCSQGRFEIFAYDPDLAIAMYQNHVIVTDRQEQTKRIDGNPFNTLIDILKNTACSQTSEFPFCGGFLGYFSYDLARSCEQLPNRHKPLPDFLDGLGGIYTWGIVTDHEIQKTMAVGILSYQALVEKIAHLDQLIPSKLPYFQLTCEPVSDMSFAEYQDRFQQIQAYIQAGDCYQVNFSQRYQASYTGHPWHAYQALRQANPTPFAAYMSYKHYHILSCSPERFLQVRQGNVLTQPIKGTSPRDPDPIHDEWLANTLLSSTKDFAENVMIVDLMRNDLSRHCIPGSVKVPKLGYLESFPNVHHLVSEISGQLVKGQHALHSLRDCFPGGSITGAPKIRAMEIIEELELSRRGICYGSIGYLSFNGNMDTNIAIRTMLCQHGILTMSVGGGIVADSECTKEYAECETKIKRIFQTLKLL